MLRNFQKYFSIKTLIEIYNTVNVLIVDQLYIKRFPKDFLLCEETEDGIFTRVNVRNKVQDIGKIKGQIDR